MLTLSDVLVAGGPAGTSGFVNVTINGGAYGLITAPFLFNGSVEYDCSVFCTDTLTIPITLGTPFEITLDSIEQWGNNNYVASVGMTVTLQAYTEVQLDNGFGQYFTYDQPEIISEFTAPESGTMWLTLLGIVSAVCAAPKLRGAEVNLKAA